MSQPYELSLIEAAEDIRAKRLSVAELLDSCISRIGALEPLLSAWARLTPEFAREAAQQAENRMASGSPLGILDGIPYGAKDIFDTADIKTTAGSRIWRDRVPKEDCAPVSMAANAGAVLIGKLHTTEFAAGDPAPCKNPWNVEHTPGGSSTGSGVAVAARMVPWAFGSQTVGSVLRPAAYNGVVGFKPTFGRISRRGVIPHAQSFDHVGVLARTVADTAVLLSVLAGFDPRDQDSSDVPTVDYMALLDTVRNPRIGLLRGWFSDQSDAETRLMVEDVALQMIRAGAELREVDTGIDFDYGYVCHRTMQQTEIAHFHRSMFEDSESLYGPKIADYIRLGLAFSATEYVTAMNYRRDMRIKAEIALNDVDVLLMPTVSGPAPRDLTQTGDTRFQSPWSFTGLPSISIPAGLAGNGMPLGIQLVGAPFREAKLLQLAHWSEQLIGFDRIPSV